MAKPRPPTALPVSEGAIPAEQKALPQWVCWRYAWMDKGQKWTKLPINAKTGKRASSTNAKTWTTFQGTLQAYQHPQKDFGEYCLSNHIQSEDLGHIPIDPKASKQGHGQINHFLGFGHHD